MQWWAFNKNLLEGFDMHTTHNLSPTYENQQHIWIWADKMLTRGENTV